MPVAAVATACPRSVSPRRTALRIASSSSTTRMLVMPEPYDAGAAHGCTSAGWDDAVMSSRRTVALGVAAWLVVVDGRRRAGVGGDLAGRRGGGELGAARRRREVRAADRVPPTATGTGRPAGRRPAGPGDRPADLAGRRRLRHRAAARARRRTRRERQPNDGWRVEVDDNGPRQVRGGVRDRRRAHPDPGRGGLRRRRPGRSRSTTGPRAEPAGRRPDACRRPRG